MRRVESFEKTLMLGRIGGKRRRGRQDEMAGWHHWLDGCESEWTPGVGDGQGGLACCDSWGQKESDTTERLNWTELNWCNWEETMTRGGMLGVYHPPSHCVRFEPKLRWSRTWKSESCPTLDSNTWMSGYSVYSSFFFTLSAYIYMFPDPFASPLVRDKSRYFLAIQRWGCWLQVEYSKW